MNKNAFIFHYECVITMKLLNLFLNISTPQSTDQLLFFVCIDCLIIHLNGMSYLSE